MYELARIKRVKAGSPPGTLTYAGPDKDFVPSMECFRYGPGKAERMEGLPAGTLEEGEVLWVRLNGVHEPATVRAAVKPSGLSDMLVEDVLNVSQRPKLDEDETALLIVVKVYRLDDDGLLREEQLSLVLGQGVVVSLSEGPEDPFASVAKRILAGRGRVRKSGPDYLLVALLDAMVDDLFLTLQTLGEGIEELEESFLGGQSKGQLDELYRLRRAVTIMRGSARPFREVVLALKRNGSGALEESNLVFARDLADHGLQAVELVESYRESLSALLDVAMTTASIRLGETTRVLTVIATIFIPLTFIAGVYGMNFEHMPELGWHFGYLWALGLMVVVAVALVAHFRRRGWL